MQQMVNHPKSGDKPDSPEVPFFNLVRKHKGRMTLVLDYGHAERFIMHPVSPGGIAHEGTERLAVDFEKGVVHLAMFDRESEILKEFDRRKVPYTVHEEFPPSQDMAELLHLYTELHDAELKEPLSQSRKTRLFIRDGDGATDREITISLEDANKHLEAVIATVEQQHTGKMQRLSRGGSTIRSRSR